MPSGSPIESKQARDQTGELLVFLAPQPDKPQTLTITFGNFVTGLREERVNVMPLASTVIGLSREVQEWI